MRPSLFRHLEQRGIQVGTPYIFYQLIRKFFHPPKSSKNLVDLDFAGIFAVNKHLWQINNTVELQWLEHLWDYENIFKTGVVRTSEC